MNIKARINARRIVLAFFYAKYLTEQLSQKDNMVSEILNIDKAITAQKDVDSDKSAFFDILKNYYSSDFN